MNNISYEEYKYMPLLVTYIKHNFLSKINTYLQKNNIHHKNILLVKAYTYNALHVILTY